MMTHEKLYKILVSNGFSGREASRLSRPRTNQFSRKLQNPDVLWKSGVLQQAIKSRRNWILNCRANGFSDAQIKKAISAFYQGHEKEMASSPFKFIKLEYAVETKDISNYSLANRLRTREQVNRVARVMGVRYGKKTPAMPKPKPELFVKQPQDNFLGKI